MQFNTVKNYYSPEYSGLEDCKKYICLQEDIINTRLEIERLSTLLAKDIKTLKADFTEINFWERTQNLGGCDRHISYSNIIDLSQPYFFDPRADCVSILSELLKAEFEKIAQPSDVEKTDHLYLWLREQKIFFSFAKQETIWHDFSFTNNIEKLYEIDEAIVPPELISNLTEIKSRAKKYSDLNNLTKEITELRTQTLKLKYKLKTDSDQLGRFNAKDDARSILEKEFKKAIGIFHEQSQSLTDPILKEDIEKLLNEVETRATQKSDKLYSLYISNEAEKYSFDSLLDFIGDHYARRFRQYEHDLITEIKSTLEAHQANLELINSRDFTNQIIAENQSQETEVAPLQPHTPSKPNFFTPRPPSFLSNIGYFKELDKLENKNNFNIENKNLIQTLHRNLKKEAGDYAAGIKDLITWQTNSLALIESHLKIGSELRGYAKPIVQNSLNVLINILACVGMLIVGYIIYAAIKGPFSPVDFSNKTEKLLRATSSFIQNIAPDENQLGVNQALGSPGGG